MAAATRRRGLPRRVSNWLLLVATAVALLTGLLTWFVVTDAGRWVVAVHGAAGLLLLLLVPWKTPVVRSGLARGRRTRWLSLLLLAVTVLALVTGVLHATGLATAAGGQLMMWWHVASGFTVAALLVWHALARRQPLRRTDLDRRLALRAGGVALGAGAMWLATSTATTALALPGEARRPTGSYLLPRPRPTIWLFDSTPARADADPVIWHVDLTDADGTRTVPVTDLAGSAERTRRTVVIDCTSGWASEQPWTGVPLAALVRPAPGDRSALVRSRTGYARRFPIAELDDLLLATDMADAPLDVVLGGPVRLVVPDQRGFAWVKWVAEVRTDPAPPWAQPPVPLR
ncbi:molybdopterin-dependent oxidoreductase [Aquipuribacter sp. SD81]|uniref:molybdopterin-dependent oxidoreductase n=1 Tax=Aquipuribacter sp. SD81 TaxID=3127703 RepID=UPI00301AC5F6